MNRLFVASCQLFLSPVCQLFFFCWVLILKPRPKRSRGSHLSLEAIRDLDALRVAFGEASEGGANAAETNAALDALAKRLEEVISATGLGESWCTNKCT